MANKIKIFLLIAYSELMYCLPEKMVAIKPVVDMRTAPIDAVDFSLPASSVVNPYQGSQLLIGDYVTAQKKFTDKQGVTWCYVNADNQQRFTQELGWHGFPGWVKADDLLSVQNCDTYNAAIKGYLAPVYNKNNEIMFWLSAGTQCKIDPQSDSQVYQINFADGSNGFVSADYIFNFNENLDEYQVRQSIVDMAKQFMGTFYCWGGRSAQNKAWTVSGVDCSGLIHLIFTAHNMTIPRTTRDQCRKACNIECGKDLQVGDLIYICPVSEKNSEMCHMTHVFLYVGDGMLLESNLSGDGTVRMISFTDRVGFNLQECKSGDMSPYITSQGKLGIKYRMYFASFFKN